MAYLRVAAVVAALTTFVISAPAGVPDYVLKYAPVVWLHSQDPYLPSDLQTHLDNITPKVNFTAVQAPSPLNLDNLNQLGSDVALTSNDDVSKHPVWLNGIRPNTSGKTEGGNTAAVIVNDHGDGNVDAFYMYFYSFDYGGIVAGIEALNFGNHVGDWEHNMVRFTNGVPQSVWYSQHANGQAFQYAVTEKYTDNARPVAYSANGTHANFGTAGTHDHTIPNLNLPSGPLQDYTEKGIFWDPLQAAYFAKYDANAKTFTAYDDAAPINWLSFAGAWGDEKYPADDPRQYEIFGQAHYVTGPTGPQDKQLNRTKVCPDNGNICIVRGILVPRSEELEGMLFTKDIVV